MGKFKVCICIQLIQLSMSLKKSEIQVKTSGSKREKIHGIHNLVQEASVSKNAAGKR